MMTVPRISNPRIPTAREIKKFLFALASMVDFGTTTASDQGLEVFPIVMGVKTKKDETPFSSFACITTSLPLAMFLSIV